jgi:glycogen phosphorylase
MQPEHLSGGMIASGEENFLLFGLTMPEIEALQSSGYRPRDFYEHIPLLKEVIDGLQDGRFSKGDRSGRSCASHLRAARSR